MADPKPKKQFSSKAVMGPLATTAGSSLALIGMTHLNRYVTEPFPKEYGEAWAMVLGLVIGLAAAWLTRDRDESER